MSAETIQKARALIDRTVVGHLATVENAQPRVRPIAMKWVGERELWFATFDGSRKLTQLTANPAVEVAFTDASWSHVRVSGTTSTTKDDIERQKLFELIPDLSKHFDGPTDPNYVLVKIAVARVEYMDADTVEYAIHEF